MSFCLLCRQLLYGRQNGVEIDMLLLLGTVGIMVLFSTFILIICVVEAIEILKSLLTAGGVV